MKTQLTIRLMTSAASALIFSYLLGASSHALASGGKNKTQTNTSSSSSANCASAGFTFTSCVGSISGNDVNRTYAPELNTFLNTSLGSNNWTFGGKSDSEGSSVGALGFTWTENTQGTGTWGLSSEYQNYTGDFVISLKAGNSWSAYYLNDVNNLQNIAWDTKGVALAGNGRNGKNLSHASIFYANLVNNTPDPKPVPEPLIPILSLAGLALLKKKI